MDAFYTVAVCLQMAHARLTSSVEKLAPMTRLVLLSLRLRLRDGQAMRMTVRDIASYAGMSASTVTGALHQLHACRFLHWDIASSMVTMLPLPELDGKDARHWHLPHARLPRCVEQLPKMARLLLISIRLRMGDHQTVRLTLKELASYAGISPSTASQALHCLHAEGFVRWVVNFSEITPLPLCGLEGSLDEYEDVCPDQQDLPADQAPAVLQEREGGTTTATNASAVSINDDTPVAAGSRSESASSYDHDSLQQQKDGSLDQKQTTSTNATETGALRFAMHQALSQSHHTGKYNDPKAVEKALRGRPDATLAEFETDLAYAKARPKVYSPIGLTLYCWAEGKRVSPPEERSPRPQRQEARRSNNALSASSSTSTDSDLERPIENAAVRDVWGFVGDELHDVPPAPFAADDQHATERDLLEEARRIAPDANAEELEMLAGELALGESAEAALHRLQTQRLRSQYLPSLDQVAARQPAGWGRR